MSDAKSLPAENSQPDWSPGPAASSRLRSLRLLEPAAAPSSIVTRSTTRQVAQGTVHG